MLDLTILVDMDEVLVDFVGGALKVHGVTREELEDRRPAGVWDISQPLGLSDDKFWEPIHTAGHRFWLDLKPLPWAEEVLTLVQKYVGDQWFVVSAPSRCPTSYDGKVQWLKTFFGERFDRFILTRHKSLFAKPEHLLIDDRDINCHRFIRAGGKSITFPSRGNHLYKKSVRPVNHVKERLDALECEQR